MTASNMLTNNPNIEYQYPARTKCLNTLSRLRQDFSPFFKKTSKHGFTVVILHI